MAIPITCGELPIEGGTRFPNAAHYSGAAEWDFWNGPDILTTMPQEMHGMVTTTQSHYAR